MTTPAQAAAQAKTYVGYAEKGASKISELAKAAKKLEDDGKTLSDIDNVLSKLAFMSKIAVGLQVMSVGLSVVQAFLPIKSKEDQILDAVQQVGRDVANLKSVVDLQFQGMSTKLLDATARQTLEGQVAIIKNAHTTLSTMAFNRRNKKSTALQEKSLQTVDLSELRKAVGIIQDYCVGTILAPNILKICYNQNWGNVDEVLAMGTYLLQYAHMAASTHAAVEVIKARAANPNFTDADAFDLVEAVAGDVADSGSYQARLKNIADQVHIWGQKCVDSKYRHGLIQAYFSFYTTMNKNTLDSKDLSGTATRLHDALKEKWPLLNFSIMAYKNLSGYEQHGMSYSGPADSRTLTFLHHPDKNGDKMNIVMYFVRRTSKTLPKTIGYADATKASDAIRRKAINAVSSALNQQHQFGFGYWNQTRVSNVLDFKSIYGITVNPSHPNYWSGDFLWIGWNNDCNAVNSSNARPLVGLSSDNPVIAKRATRSEQETTGPNQVPGFYDLYEGYDVLVIHDDAH